MLPTPPPTICRPAMSMRIVMLSMTTPPSASTHLRNTILGLDSEDFEVSVTSPVMRFLGTRYRSVQDPTLAQAGRSKPVRVHGRRKCPARKVNSTTALV